MKKASKNGMNIAWGGRLAVSLIFLLLFSAFLFSACGGGGSSSAPSAGTSPVADTGGAGIATGTATIPAYLLGGSIQKPTPLSLGGVVTTFAGTATVEGGTDGTGSAARFFEPQSLTTDGTYLYAGDYTVIRKISIASGSVTTLAGTNGMSDYADGTGTSARFKYPNGITTDGTYLYVTEFGDHTIRKVVIATGVVTTIAGGQGVSGLSDGTGTSARFNGPAGITTDGTNLYVAEHYGQTIRKITGVRGRGCTLTFTPAALAGSTTVWTLPVVGSITIAAPGYGYAVGDVLNVPTAQNGTGTVTVGGVDSLDGVTSLSAVTLGTGYNNTPYTAQATTSNALALVRTFRVTTLAGAKDVVTSWLDATGTAARFNTPSGITMDATNLYVTDMDLIRKIVIATGAVTTLAGDTSFSSLVFSGLKGGITSDGANLYVSDDSGIRKVVIASGAVTDVAGKFDGTSGTTDATGTAARFRWPTGLTSDGTSLYVEDSLNNTIRKIQ